jgi:hypothetical protein
MVDEDLPVTTGRGRAEQFIYEYLCEFSADWPSHVYSGAVGIAIAFLSAENPGSPAPAPTEAEIEMVRLAMLRLAERDDISVTYIDGQLCGRIRPGPLRES